MSTTPLSGCARRSIERFPNEVVSQSIQLEIYKAKGEYDTALRLCEKVIERFPNEAVAWNIQLEIYKAKGEYDTALRLCEKVIEKFPNEAVSQSIQLEIYKAKGEYDTALRLCEKVIERFPNEVVPRCIQLEIYKAKGEYDTALRLCEKVIERFPNEAVSRNIQLEIYKAKGEYDTALRLCEKVIERFPNEVVSRNIHVEIYKAKGEYDTALRLCEKVIEKFSNDAFARATRLSLMLLAGGISEADFSVVDTRPTTESDFVEYHILGMYYLRTGRYDRAVACFHYGLNNAYTLQTKSYFSSALAVAQIRRDQQKKVIPLFSEADSTLKTNPFKKLIYVHAVAKDGNTEEAERAVSEVTTEEPHHLRLKYALVARYALRLSGQQPLFAGAVPASEQIIETEEEYLLLDRAA